MRCAAVWALVRNQASAFRSPHLLQIEKAVVMLADNVLPTFRVWAVVEEAGIVSHRA